MRKRKRQGNYETFHTNHCLLIFKDSNQDRLGIFTLQYPFKQQHVLLKPAISLIREDLVFNSFKLGAALGCRGLTLGKSDTQSL